MCPLHQRPEMRACEQRVPREPAGSRRWGQGRTPGVWGQHPSLRRTIEAASWRRGWDPRAALRSEATRQGSEGVREGGTGAGSVPHCPPLLPPGSRPSSSPPSCFQAGPASAPAAAPPPTGQRAVRRVRFRKPAARSQDSWDLRPLRWRQSYTMAPRGPPLPEVDSGQLDSGP